jgi:Tfp pilus assembly protein PilF
MLIENADVQNGLDVLNRAIQMDPTIPEAYLNRAAAYDILGHTSQNLDYYPLEAADLRKALEIAKDQDQIDAANAALRLLQTKGYIP